LRAAPATRRKSLRRLRRAGRRSIAQALRRLRPLARRLASTFRPPTVDMRERKPWRRLRIRTLGWYVRFTALLRSANGWKEARCIEFRRRQVNRAASVNDPLRSRNSASVADCRLAGPMARVPRHYDAAAAFHRRGSGPSDGVCRPSAGGRRAPARNRERAVMPAVRIR
jgi:hypothetical protein